VGSIPIRGTMSTVNPGLCDSCVNAQRVTSSRGAEFTLCRLSAIDPRYPRYPTLPVLQCAGYDARAPRSPDK
jgi:hypothetical protein